MSSLLMKGVVLNQPIMLRRTHFFDKGSRAIILNESYDRENFMFLIKNDMAANKDGFFILGREELEYFDKSEFHNFFNEEFKGLEVISNKYYPTEDGSLEINEPYTLHFSKNGKFVSKWIVNKIDDKIKIEKMYLDENFKNEFEFFLNQKDREAKELFYKNAVNLKWELDTEELERSFATYISDCTYGLRTYEENIIHEYINLNQLNPGIIRRFNFRDELVRDNIPFVDLQTGVMFKVLDTVDISKDKILKKGDFYQIVKKWNNDYYLELLNVNNEINYNGKNRAIVISCDKNMIKENFRNVLNIEKESLYDNNVIRGLEIGEEVEFNFDISKRSRNLNTISISKGMKGTVLESDYKIRLAIKDEENDEIVYRDFYRSEILKVTTLKNNIREWMVTPQKTNVEYQNIWSKEKEISESKLYHKGRFVAELDKNNRLNFHNEIIEKEYDKLKSMVFSKVKNEIKKIKEKDIDLIMISYLIKLPAEIKPLNTQEFSQCINNIKNEKEIKNVKYH